MGVVIARSKRAIIANGVSNPVTLFRVMQRYWFLAKKPFCLKNL